MDPLAFRLAAALAAAMAISWLVDRGAERRGLLPPGFAVPWRRAAAAVVVAGEILLAVFLPLASYGLVEPVDTATLAPYHLLLAQELMLLSLLVWLALGWMRVGTAAPAEPGAGARGRDPASQLGLRSRRPLFEVALGLVAGLGAWAAVLMVAFGFGALVVLFGGEGLLEEIQRPAPEIVWMAGLGVGWKLAISFGAGFAEEIFFRGFLQRRIGIGLSTLLFVIGHLGYGQPFMLLSLTVLSLIYAWLVRWRGNVWAAVTAHFLFDAVQLLVVIPFALQTLESSSVA